MEKDKEALKREADDARSATDGLVRDKVKKTGRKKNEKNRKWHPSSIFPSCDPSFFVYGSFA